MSGFMMRIDRLAKISARGLVSVNSVSELCMLRAPHVCERSECEISGLEGGRDYAVTSCGTSAEMSQYPGRAIIHGVAYRSPTT